MLPTITRSQYVNCRRQKEYLANRTQIVGFLAAGLVMTTSAVSTLIYQNAGTMQAAAAGFILLSMISVSLLLLFRHKPN